MGRALPKRDVSVSWPACAQCGHKHQEGSSHPLAGTWAARRIPVGDTGVVWLKRPMPNGQWPADQSLPRDDSWSWWIRSSCGHEGGAKQWAFRREADADTYETIFRADPCRYTRCPQSKIENERKLSCG